MTDIRDLQEEIIARALRALESQFPEQLHAEVVALARKGRFLDNGALHELLTKAAARDLSHVD